MRKFYVLTAAAMLTACGSGGNEGGLTAEENAELNNAAAMLDSETLPPLDEPVNVGETAELPATDEAATNAQ
jgi:hypothetical protein